MLRLSSKLNSRVSSKVIQASGRRRLQSTYSGGGGGGGKGLMGTAAACTVVAGVVGYSAWSPENRKGVENLIPGSGFILGTILGPLPEPAPPKPDVGLVRKRLEREKKKVKDDPKETAIMPEATAGTEEVSPESLVAAPEEVSSEPSVGASAEAPNLDAESLGGISGEVAGAETTSSGMTIITTGGQKPDPVIPTTTTEEKAEPAASDLEERLASGEVAEGVENAALVQTLEDISVLAQNQIDDALKAAEDAAVVIRKHAERAYQAIDAGQDKETLFAAVSELSVKRAEMIKTAQEKINNALDTVDQLKHQIKSGYESPLTKDNKTLISAEEKLGEFKYAIDTVKAIISESERDGKIVNDYKDLIESGREQFETELKSLLPEVKLGETSDKLTTDELNLLIAHAHRKVLQLQKQVARQQADVQSIEHDRFKDALNKQRDEDGKILEAKITAELDKQSQQLEVEYRRKVAQLREELEGELRAQLKRQAAAHSDHLADVLSVQEKELESKWLNHLDDEVHAVKNQYLTSLAEMQGQLGGLKNAMADRADVDKAAYAARELWLACDSLRSALRLGTEQAKSWEEQLKPLSDHVNAIKAAGGERNPFISAVVKSIPEEALEKGVYTEEAIRERFLKVERVCKRVSMIGDNGGSLLRYLLSYMQSFLILNAFEYLPGAEVRNEEVAVDTLSTYEILARARYCLDKDDLQLSVRYMNLLRGEPRNVASSWLKEARLTLEARQAADALLAHAAATAVKAR